MRIDNIEAQNFIHDKLANRESFYLTGIAGSGKSSVMNHLRTHGYNSCIVFTPTNQLRIEHEKKRSNTVDEFTSLTLASATQSVNRASIDYDALNKDITLDADIFIFDELYTLDIGLTSNMIEHITKLGKPYILLGDPWQDSIINKRQSAKFLEGLEGLTLDESLRGTPANRLVIQGFYIISQLKRTITPTEIADAIVSAGGKVIYDWPTDPNARYGYTANYTQAELIERISFTDKIFTGKVRYKKDDTLGKAWEKAPIVSQVQKQAIEAITGITVPIATPKNTFNSKTCIGVEILPDEEYYVVLDTSKLVNAVQAYTLFSRHVDPSKITVCLIDKEKYTLETQFNRQDTIADTQVISPIRYITTTDAKLGLKSTGSKAQTHVKLKRGVFKDLLELTGERYTNQTGRIYTESYSIEGSAFGAESIEEYLSRPEEKHKTATPEKTTAMIAELLQSCPGLVCDPHHLHFLEGEYYDVGKIAKALYIKPEVEETHISIPYKPVDVYFTTGDDLEDFIETNIYLELQSPPQADFLDAPYTVPSEPKELYEIDLNYAEWQMISNYAELIGYGPMTTYDASSLIHYGAVLYNNRPYILNSKVIDIYREAGVELSQPIWLASRPKLLSDVLTDETKQELLYNRHIRYDKLEANGGWGKLQYARYVEVNLLHGEVAEKVIQDNDKKSALFTLSMDIKAIEALIVSLIGLNQEGTYTADTDSIKSNNPLNTEWNYTIPKPDYTYTHYIEHLKTTVHKNEYHKLANLQQYLDRTTKDKYISRWPVSAKKVHNYLNYGMISKHTIKNCQNK